MEWLREWALCICAISVFGAAVNLLVPESRYENLINMGVSLVVILIVVAPFAKLESCELSFFEVHEYRQEENAFEECVESQMLNYLSDTAEGIAAAKLDECGILYEEISVSMDSYENGCISIGQVTVILNDDQLNRKEQVQRIIQELFGSEDVIVTGGFDEQDQKSY